MEFIPELIDKLKELLDAALRGEPSAVIILACLVAGVVIWLFVRKKKDDTSQNSENGVLQNIQNEINIELNQEKSLNPEIIDARDEAIERLESECSKLSSELDERKDFIEFIEYLFKYDFTILPKICLALDRTREFNQVNIRKLTAIYEYDMTQIDLAEEEITASSDIKFDGRITFCTETVNRDLPKEYVRYMGNMYAEKLPPVYQRHGNQVKFEAVSYNEEEDKTEIGAGIRRYSWDLVQEDIGHEDTVDIDYFWDCKESGKARGGSTLILYPKHHGKKIEKIEIKVIFKSDRIVLKKFDLHRIRRSGKAQRYNNTPMKCLNNCGNEVSYSFVPDENGYEVYYVKLEWDLAEEK